MDLRQEDLATPNQHLCGFMERALARVEEPARY